MKELLTASSKPKSLKSALSVRGDSLYCPLCFSLDSYWNCLTDCWHCYLRRLNHTWGNDLRPSDPDEVDKKLYSGLRNKKPLTPLAHCLRNKKTIRFGNKTDPFQEVEKDLKVSKRLLRVLLKHNWTFVIQTRFLSNMGHCDKTLDICRRRNLFTLMPVLSPGIDKDWEILERKRTTRPIDRLKVASNWKNRGVHVGVNGEPFIPGFHTENDFEEVLKLVKSFGINRYNTYNFHFNGFVARRLHENCPEVDIEKIWFYNQDENWNPILQKLLDISKKHNFILGCPDFVNSGWGWLEKANTCCGIDVHNPCTFNSHFFKKRVQEGKSLDSILEETWDGSGNYDKGINVLYGKPSEFYTLKDVGPNPKKHSSRTI